VSRVLCRMRIACALLVFVVATVLAGCSGRTSHPRRPEYGGLLAVSLRNPARGDGSLHAYVEVFPASATQDQEITVLVIVTNASQQPVMVNSSIGPYSCVTLEITDHRGRRVYNEHSQAACVVPKEADLVNLWPRMALGIALHTSPAHWSVHRAGEYQIRARCYPFSVTQPGGLKEDLLSKWVKLQLTS
jgi:hypothetical protein